VLAIALSHINKSLQWQWFAEELLARGTPHVFILIDRERPLLAEDLARLGSRAYFLRHRGTASHLRNLAAMLRILRRHRVSVLHSSLPYGNLLGQSAAAILGIRTRVTTCENPHWAKDQGSLKQELIDRLTFRLASRVIACTKLAEEYIHDVFGVPLERLTIIPHSLKVSEYEHVAPERVEALRRQLGLSPGDFVVGMIARLERWKGHFDAVEAMRTVVARDPKVKLLIFGSRGEAHDDLVAAIGEAGLEANVRYCGFVPDTTALYQLFDVHMHVPVDKLVENTGINIIEGMISGRAQILTRSGFAYELARHLDNAWVVDYRSPGQIAEAILGLRADPALRERLGRKARQDALERFDYREKVDRHLELYGMAPAGPPRSRTPGQGTEDRAQASSSAGVSSNLSGAD
jgi:glycosyltransferase involved in cell wall biosynthesis